MTRTSPVFPTVDLIELHDTEEAYYSVFRTSRPEKHLRSDDELAVLRPGRPSVGSAWWAMPHWAAASNEKKPGSASPAMQRPVRAKRARGR